MIKKGNPTDFLEEAPSVFFSDCLDHVRWISAFFVMTGHVRNVLFPPYDRIQHPSAFDTVFYAVTNFQNEAVICFFVISGYLIGGKLYRYYHQGAVPIKKYIIDRLTRLYIVLIPAILLTMIVSALVDGDIGDIQTYLGSLFYLQHILTVLPPFNPPLWSLANEFWYYTIGLIVILLPQRRLIAAILLAAILTLLLIDTFTRENVLVCLPMWCIGAMLIRHDLLGKADLGLVVAGMIFIGVLVISRRHVLDDLFVMRDYGIVAGLFLLLLSLKRRKTARTLMPGLGRIMASFSFSLYLIHWPVLMLIKETLKNLEIIPNLTPIVLETYVIYVTACVTCLLAAFIFAFFTERQTNRVRKKILSILNPIQIVLQKPR